MRNIDKLEYILEQGIFLEDKDNDILATIYAKTLENMSLSEWEQNYLNEFYSKFKRD